jgi:excisionase family DNA binding protein
MEISRILTNATPERSLSRPRAAALLGISLPTLIRAVERGEIRVIRIGAREHVPVDEIERILAGTDGPGR